jgi:hypothetical protein
VVFLLYGTKVALFRCRVKLNVRADLRHRDICDEDYLSVDDYMESRLKDRK